MPFYDLPRDLRIAWSMFPSLSKTDRQRLRRQPLPGFFETPEVRPVLQALGMTTLDDLTRLLPEEILGLPNASPDVLHELAVYVSLVVTDRPPARSLGAAALKRLDRAWVREAALPKGTADLLVAAGITTLGEVARTHNGVLDTLGLSLVQQRGCIAAFRNHWPNRSDAARKRAFQARPLPVGFADRPFAEDDLGRSWLGARLKRIGLTTYGDAMRFVDEPHSRDRRLSLSSALLGIQHFVALEAASSITGTTPTRVPYRTEDYVPLRLMPSGWSVTEGIQLDAVRWTQQQGVPDWAKALDRHGIDSLALVARSDLAFLWDVAQGDASQVCAMIAAVRRALMESRTPGSGIALYGEIDPGLSPAGRRTAGAPHTRARQASIDPHSSALERAKELAAEAIHCARSPGGKPHIAFHHMKAGEQIALIDDAEAAIRATFAIMAEWDDATIARFVRAHRR
ncbi:hypothetical protein [Methylorubrum zatmanii]|uniref:Uncharacterized protein n=1 Tax=Methylorubrum zatmanii TaxID=29429 RepID=A0ABW1WPR4_9HYPH|nr:hypothetical protein [Methylorubrum zatmanii]